MFSAVIDKFCQKFPAGMMAHGLLEHVFSPTTLPELFPTQTETQYERKILFADLVD
jgi:hypothetical protein